MGVEHLVPNGRQRHTAGGSSLAMFRTRRRAAIRAHWRDWGALAIAIVGSIIAVAATAGLMQLVFAGLVGALVTVAIVGWLVGDVRSLSWAWGAVGEQDTAAVLDGLDEEWLCLHDLQREHSNWDHVLVGPPGVLLLDTKVLTAPARASDDALRAGRQVMPGGSFRGAAVGLADALRDDGSGRPWVQPVVVIWGDFEQAMREEQRVVYVHGTELLNWLTSLPTKLDDRRRRDLADRVEAIASRAREDGRLPLPKP